MTATAERARLFSEREQKTVRNLQDIMTRIPDVVRDARKETETSEIAHSPEGKYALTYLLAARRLIAPILNNASLVNTDLLEPLGGPEYNPQRSIDEIGTAVAYTLAEQTTDIPNLWIHSEESPSWERAHPNGDEPKGEERFAVIDPLDMTHSMPIGNRVQTTGIAIFDRNGAMKAAGIASLVDDGFVFIERTDHDHIYTNPSHTNDPSATPDVQPLRVATLTRRMHKLRSLPIFTRGSAWAMDCTSGYAILGLHEGKIDTIIDPIKGNPWYEVAIWGTTAQALGMTMTDQEGNPVDIAAMMRRVIDKHEGDSYRIPFVISRTPEIHKKVLSLLHTQP